MLSRISRAFAGLTMWIFIAACFAALGGVAGLSNYLGCVASFYLLNIDRMPLWLDELLGLFFQVFLGEATVAHLLALSLTCGIASGWFLVTYIAFEIFELVRDRRDYVNRGDRASAKAALELIVLCVIMLVVLALLLCIACIWDIGLWHYRSAAAALGISDPLTAVGQVPAWDIFLDKYGGLFAPNAARFGGWGYIAVTALVSVGMAIALRYVGQFWHKLLQAFSDLWNLDPDDPDPNDPDQDEAEAVLEYPQPNDMQPEPVGPEPGGQIQNPPDEPQEVIGGDGERVTVADAVNNERYWVDPVTREIWDATFRESLLN